MTDRRVLIVSREIPPSMGPHPIRVAKLAKYLPEFGWNPTILSVPTDHVVDRDELLAAEMEGVAIIRVPRLLARVAPPAAHSQTLAAPGETRAAVPDRPRAGFRSRLGEALLLPDSSVLWAIPAARRAVAIAGDFDAVLTTAPPFSTHLIGNRVARATKLPWVAEYRDNWTVNPLYKRGSAAQWINRLLERRCLSAAAAIIVVSEAAGAEMEAAFPAVAGRVHVARNGYDPDDLPKRGSRPDVFEIAYGGTLAERRDPRPFFAALGKLAGDVPEFGSAVRLRLMGHMAEWVVASASAAIGPDKVQFDGLLTHREALARGSRAAVLLGITTRNEAGGAGFTSKLFEYLALGRPVLMLAPAGPARDLVVRSGGGAFADPDDIPAIAAATGRLFEEWRTGAERQADQSVLAGLTRRATAQGVAGALDAAVASQPRPARR